MSTRSANPQPHSRFKLLSNVIINNKITGDTYTGSIVDEDEIEGRKYWVFYSAARPQHRMLLAKEYYTIRSKR